MLDIPATLIALLSTLLIVLLLRHWLLYYRPHRKDRIVNK